MSKIKISGTIVSADYDEEFFAPWIAKGIITPSNHIVKALEEATEPVELVINSYGGDVFAGGEMYVAITKALAAGKIASVEVQSYACSMAANIVAALAARKVPVTAYTSTQIMFHGCYTVAEGGAQHFEDTASALRAINDTVIENLKALGIEGCGAWFNEGREKWINGTDALEMKLVSSLADGIIEEAPEMKTTASRFAALARPGVGDYRGACAALVADRDLADLRAAYKDLSSRSAALAEEKAKLAEDVAGAIAREASLKETLDGINADLDAKANERFAALQSKHDKKISALEAERDAALKDLESAMAESTSLKASIGTLEASLATVRDQLAEEKAEHERDIQTIREGGISLCLPEATEKMDAKTARETLSALPPSERNAFYQAHKAEIDG